MARQFLGFGTGVDGDVVLGGTDAPIDSSCSGSAGSFSLSATNASFAAGQMIMIHQTRGTGAGAWELNVIKSYTPGTITTDLPLESTYTDSGASQAQVLVVKQYSGVSVTGTFTGKAWNGATGGIMFILCSGKADIVALAMNGADGVSTTSDGGGYGIGGGFYGGGVGLTGNARCGEGTDAASAQQTTANGNGGGGASSGAGDNGGAGGGNGSNGGNGNSGAVGGNSVGNVSLTVIDLGGGGGGGRNDSAGDGAGGGGSGGGIVIIMARELVVSLSVNCNGGRGYDMTIAGRDTADGGSGAGGSVLIKAQIANIGSNLITANGGAAASHGGAGGAGRIRIEAGKIIGTTSPSANTQEGANSWNGRIGCSI